MAFWSKKPATHTNAPRHWPAVELTQFEHEGVNLITIGGQLAGHFGPPNGRVAFMHDFLYEDGILRVPILVEEGGRQTGVFAYSKHDANAAAHYSGVRALLRTRENAGAVYYGPEALQPTRAAAVLQPIDTPFFSTPAEPPQNASYALWWASAEQPRLAGSEEQAWLDRWFEALDGYGFLLLTAFLRDLELVEDEGGVYALPDQPLLQPVVGPGGTSMLLHASAQEGLFLAFEESTAPARRRLLLRLLADFAAGYRQAIDAKGLAPRAEERGPGLACWRAVRDQALAKEAAGAAGLKLHAVAVREGQPVRNPNASTADERAAQPALPGAEDLDFGMDLVERLAARMKGTGAAGSTEEELGAPNFAPVVAVKVGPDVFERQLPLEDTPVAQAVAARALDEWPEAEVVAVVADGAVRENGRRVDIFDVKLENHRTRTAGLLFQRYAAAGGRFELIGRPSARPTEPFLLPASSPREPAPDEALAALARQALDEIVKSLTVLEPSGMCGDDPEDALLSPSALVGRPGDPRPLTVRFMLQGPLTAALSCRAQLEKEPADWVVFHLDDLVSRNGLPERRLRLCVQRRADPGAAIFDLHYAAPRRGVAFAPLGELRFVRWGGSLFAPA